MVEVRRVVVVRAVATVAAAREEAWVVEEGVTWAAARVVLVDKERATAVVEEMAEEAWVAVVVVMRGAVAKELEGAAVWAVVVMGLVAVEETWWEEETDRYSSCTHTRSRTRCRTTIR